MTKKDHTIDFGAPEIFGAHVFRVEIPANKTDPICIFEDYGLQGGDNGLPNEELRAIIPRILWAAISETARSEFNERLKEKKLATGRWKVGKNLLDRFLGRELCILVWASETATLDLIPSICSRWAAFRPEERWWLFGMAYCLKNGCHRRHRHDRRRLDLLATQILLTFLYLRIRINDSATAFY